ncbi:GNAT family N-acetyltransferase [Novosphingobium sp. 1949]|uniref:GNAT family N-acetyltransferase n=1 Tax=Novosphingobium organovorum TaxID=2930092 RepID=A0ABT0BEG9_9SPHN|nr:GNAT family N-acetyltransferase [Novosphingobium organovorum]MCJ2183300.1 GNAT family N-acetyltransferase [Novosphingobium organovorum]
MEIESSPGDLIAEMGYMTLGSRFRRLGERLQAGVAEAFRAAGYTVQPAQVPILQALREGPMTVGTLVARLDVSQPAVTRSLGQLVQDGLAYSTPTRRDARQREVGLTAQGDAVIAALSSQFFARVEAAVASLCTPPADDLLAYLDRLDAGLAASPLPQRIAALSPVTPAKVPSAMPPSNDCLSPPETPAHPDAPAPADLTGPLLWTALSGEQARFALGDGDARRFHPDIGPLAGMREDSEACRAALSRLLHETGPLALMQPGPAPEIPRAQQARQALGLRMMLSAQGAARMAADFARAQADRRVTIEELGPADFAEMLALATLTEPGPFGPRTGELGRFWGVREDGRLLAMAGQRIRTGAVAEVSAVCTHPDARGRGLAPLLSQRAALDILDGGRLPILHSYADNHTAIGVYTRLGFVEQARLSLTLYVPA